MQANYSGTTKISIHIFYQWYENGLFLFTNLMALRYNIYTTKLVLLQCLHVE